MAVQSKTYSLLLYEENKRHKEIIDELILNQCNTCDYVGILHDKDIDADGNPKKPHYHIVLCYKDSTSIGQVQSRFPNLESNLIQAMNNRRDAVRYLCHITEDAKAEGKHIYEKSLLFGSPRIIGKHYTEDATSSLEIILDYIELANRAELNYTKLLRWCIEQNVHNTLRKYSFLIKEVMTEKLNRKSIIPRGVFSE